MSIMHVSMKIYTKRYSLAFSNSKSNTSLFIYSHKNLTMNFLVYVDELFLIGNSSTFIQTIIEAFSNQFSIKDLDSLYYFLEVKVIPNSFGLFLSQHKYIHELLLCFNIKGIKEFMTPINSSSQLTLLNNTPITKAIIYCRFNIGL